MPEGRAGLRLAGRLACFPRAGFLCRGARTCPLAKAAGKWVHHSRHLIDDQRDDGLCKPLTEAPPLPAEDPKTITREWAHATAAMKMGKRPIYWETKAKPAADDDY